MRFLASSRARAWPVPLVGALGSRVGDAVRAVRPIDYWPSPHPECVVDGFAITVRPPRLRDAASWAQTRIEEQSRLEGVFGGTRTWSASHTELEWVERWGMLRRAAAEGLAWPAVVAVPGRNGRILGEVGINAVDARTSSGEMSIWAARSVPHRAMLWATATMLHHALCAPRPVARVVGPISVDNPGPIQGLHVLGFTHEATLTRHRMNSGASTDHAIWVLHNDRSTRARLAAVMSDLAASPKSGAAL